MLNPYIIQEYLERKLENYDWLKLETEGALNQALSELNPPPILGPLWTHQKVCFLLIETLHRFMLHLDMGSGKTAISLFIIRYLKQQKKKPKAIVFVPYITSVLTWIDETAKHTPELVCVPLLGSTEENLNTLASSEGDLFVICYQSAVAMLSEPRKVLFQEKKKKTWVLDVAATKSVFSNFNMLFADEVHKCKNVQSLTYKMLRTISAQSDYVVGLTGTPFGKDLLDLWPQFYLIDFGETLGNTLGLFREAFFSKKKWYWGGFEYNFKKKLFATLQELIKNRSIRYRVDEFHDMPSKEYVLQRLAPAHGIKAYADKAIEAIKEAVVKKGQYRQLESEYLRLRQLSSGFMTLKGEDDDRVQIKFDENPKLEALQGLIEALPQDSKMVIFHHFIFTNALISKKLVDMKVEHARVYSKTKDPINELRRFSSDANCRVLLLNSKSGSSSLNLQNANYVVFFENPDSPIDRQQAERRVWRPGQEKRVWIYDLLMDGTWDAKIHKANADGHNLLRALLDGTVQS